MDDPTLSIPPDERQPGSGPLQSWGPFRLLEKVGQGSFGEVYRALDPVLEREVALKLLLTGYDRGCEAALSEARAIAKVRHPNVLAVYGIDTHEGRVGFWSDFVHGKTLSSILKTEGPFGPREVALIGCDLCKALGAVHGAGLLHRDVKASNVMREAGGRILLMDFGLTHDRDAGTRICGTPPYMAPELMRGDPASVGSDIYALGVLLFNLLTGKHPFAGNTFAEIRAAHQSGSRRRLMDERPDLPEQLAHAIEKAIEPDPNQRYASTGQMIAALSDATGVASASADFAGPVRPPPRRRRLLWAGAAAAVALVFVAARAPGWLGWRPLGGANRSADADAHADYLQAMDLLDHYYKPHAIDSAVALLQRTVAKDPTFAAGFAGLGRGYWWQYRDTHNAGSVAPAKQACSRALELDREMASAHVTLGMIYTDAGRTDLAAEELKEALRINAHGADAYSAQAELYQKEGRSADVEPAIQKAIDLAPGSWRYVNQLGGYYLSAGKNVAAAEQFQKAARLNPDNARALNNLGLAYRRADRLADARAAYEKSLAIDPAFNTLSNLGFILQFEGKNEEAAQIYQRAVDTNPSSYMSWSNLASAYSRIPGRKSKAREIYLKTISVAEEERKNQPDDPGLMADLGSFYAAVGASESSVPLLRKATALAPKNPQVLYRVAEGYELLHRREEALQWIAKALDSGFSLDTIKRNPELAGLRADSRFPHPK